MNPEYICIYYLVANETIIHIISKVAGFERQYNFNFIIIIIISVLQLCYIEDGSNYTYIYLDFNMQSTQI